MSDDKKIYRAIPSILADMDAIGKEKKNQQQGFMYRGIDDVYNAVHPLFAKHKVFPTCEIISREMTERQTKSGGALFYVNLKAKYTLWAEDGSSVTTEAWGEAMDSGDKASNKAMSVAYKYALFQLLCIPTEAVDPDDAVPPPVEPRQKASNGAAAARSAEKPSQTTQLQTGEADPIDRAKKAAAANASRTPEQIYADAKKAINAETKLARIPNLRGAVQQYSDRDQISAEQASALLALIDAKEADLEGAQAVGAAS